MCGCGPATVLDAKQYDESCSVATDCTAEHLGDQCVVCGCPNGAIGKKDFARFTADQTNARNACGPMPAIGCAACAMPTVTCVSGVCGLAQ